MTKKDQVKEFLIKRPGYITWGADRLIDVLLFRFDIAGVSKQDVRTAKKELRKGNRSVGNTISITKEVFSPELLAAAAEFLKSKKTFKVKEEKVVSKKRQLPSPFLRGNNDNILIIGDIHEPFSLKGYLEFCREQQEKYNCGRVVFIGDVIDSHFSSYHSTDPDGYGAGDELDRAIDKISEWYKVFPEATVIIGNHDRLAYRKAFSGGVSERWLREYNEVLKTPNWDFVENLEVFNVNINHGEGGTAKTRMKNELQSQIQGHLHSQFYIEYLAGNGAMVFGMQVGSGVDRHAYSMSYGKHYKKPIVGCGVLLDKGKLPLLCPMDIKSI